MGTQDVRFLASEQRGRMYGRANVPRSDDAGQGSSLTGTNAKFFSSGTSFDAAALKGALVTSKPAKHADDEEI